MATVAVAPACAEVNREGALMIAAVNGTIGSQSFPALDSLNQVAEKNEVNDVAPSRQKLGDGHLPTFLQAERRWRKRTLCSTQFLRTPSCLKMMVVSGIMLVDLTFLVE